MCNIIEEAIDGQIIINCFSKLADPRKRGRCLHQLIDIIIITICGILCGAQHWKKIAEFGRQRIDWLKQFGNPYQKIGVDRAGSTAIKWGVYGTPELFIIDKHGRIRGKQIGILTQSIINESIIPLLKKLEKEQPYCVRYLT